VRKLKTKFQIFGVKKTAGLGRTEVYKKRGRILGNKDRGRLTRVESLGKK